MGNTLYIYMSKISPTSLGEFARAVDTASTTKNLDSMILDLRGNVGGSLDFVQNFMGLFLGQNQYAFDLFHKGIYEAQRTVQPKFPLVDRFKEIGIITDNMTQSTAYFISATFKRLHLGKTVGVNTRGWGTVENTYPITTPIDASTTYSLLLVNSITLRDDNQPIEGRGVDPDVSTADPKWKDTLSEVFHSSSLIKALKQTAVEPPIE
jgi:C-terminal processing protease CtpA/Prc